MRIFLATVAFSFLVVFTVKVTAQELHKDEIVVIKGEKYISHQVRTGETVYSISKKYKVDQAVLKVHNPKVVNGLSIGDILKIPYVEGVNISESQVLQKGSPDGFTTHKIKSRNETPYFIAKQYGITVEELYAYNTGVRKYKKGVKVKIPFWNEVKQPVAIEKTEKQLLEAPETIKHVVVSGETLYGLSKKYKVSEHEILTINPKARNLKAGMTIYIPLKNEVVAETKPVPVAKEVAVSYFEHIIESGESMWGITRRYGVSENELKALNPILETGFPAGAVIRIPVSETEKNVAKPLNEAAFKKHLVEKGETLYGLSKKYNLSIPEIQKYNPVLENRNLVYGETILIPEQPDEIFEQIVQNNKADSTRLVEEYYEVELPTEIPSTCLPVQKGMLSDKTYNIVLFLPLFLEINDTLNREDLVLDTMSLFTAEEVEIAQDTTIELEERKELFKQFYGGSENFVQFYEGVLLAIDSLQKAGVNICLNVFDTQRKADSIRQYVFTNEFLATDLIIGPIYERVQREVAQIAAKNRIPIISPLASQSEITKSNSSYFQVNPTREYLAVQTAEMVAEEYYNSNFIVVKTKNYSGTPEGQLVDLFREKFVNSGFMSDNFGVNFTIYDFENEGSFGLRRIMSKTKENVVYIPSSNEGELSVAISNVNNLADDFSITLIGSNRFPNFSSIQVDHYHNLKLKYIAPYWIEYTNPSTIKFIEKFKTNFNTEPDNFGAQGYDVTMYFMTALTAFGNDFDDCLPYLHIDQVQGNYHFEKVTQFGGYMNQGVSVIAYTRDYRVERKRIKGQPRLMVER
ncbi:LysM peptidoglycan-binding domain-containing protein [Prolixibacteraceae bacterium Z1-6]|uniref:LysM peptidoglycan-binding domain-containing protein n=1 Tax=Draconibacterium aestuarii TaxID=2998507 RepID=A0A9X3FGM0_9BACT|nr:LysM peptidoglycan-binding domain-containing protein [Prolixibacteraceae bacterium Z1-6]